MILEGRGVSEGKVEGEVVKVDEPVSFLGDVDPETGVVFGEKSLKDSIFVFPGGKGSTVGSYVIYQCKKNGTAPKAMINSTTETIVAAGAILSEIPLVDDIPIDVFEKGDHIVVNGSSGEVELKNIDGKEVVTAFLERDGKVLLLRRSEDVGSFHNRWSAVSGYLEKGPIEQAKTEVREETGFEPGELKEEGEKVVAKGEGTVWIVHPFLFEFDREKINLNFENLEYRWVNPEEMRDMRTVPKLWEAYKAVKERKDE